MNFPGHNLTTTEASLTAIPLRIPQELCLIKLFVIYLNSALFQGFLFKLMEGWIELNGACYYSREPGFNSQNPHQAAHMTMPLVLEINILF